jgi:RNA polymerase sigma-70 factor, ECF subfamily
MSSTDAQLLSRIAAGDKGALGELLQSHQQRLYNVSLRMVGNRDDAAEIAQDALLKIIEHIGDYNGQCAVTTWMIRITMNLSISHLRKRRLRLTTSLDSAGGGGADGSGSESGGDQGTPLRDQISGPAELSPPARVEHHEMLTQLHKAMRQLDEEYRSILVLRDLQEMDYSDIAHVLDVPVGTVKSRLFRARLALRQKMQKLCPAVRGRVSLVGGDGSTGIGG